jgi:hypothetical protein
VSHLHRELCSSAPLGVWTSQLVVEWQGQLVVTVLPKFAPLSQAGLASPAVNSQQVPLPFSASLLPLCSVGLS